MNSFKELFLQAYNFFVEGNLDLAVSKLNEAEAKFEPGLETEEFNLEDLYILRGTINFGAEKFELARHDFEKALSLNHSSAEACLGLGQYFYAKGLTEHAKTMFEWSVKNNTEHPGAISALKQVNADLGLAPEHNSLFMESSGQSEDDSSADSTLARATTLFTEKKYAECLLELSKLKKEHEEILASIESFMGFNFLTLNEIEKAKLASERALKLNPASSQAYANLGEVYFLRRDFGEARRMYKVALDHNPDNNFASTGLNNTLLELAKVEEEEPKNVNFDSLFKEAFEGHSN
jgi:tetratricopeptide (TPR) repeat protein